MKEITIKGLWKLWWRKQLQNFLHDFMLPPQSRSDQCSSGISRWFHTIS